MNRSLIRLISLLLVPCLMADPLCAAAQGLHERTGDMAKGGFAGISLFDQQACLYGSQALSARALLSDPEAPQEARPLRIHLIHTVVIAARSRVDTFYASIPDLIRNLS